MSETVRHEPKLFAASGPVTGHEGKYTVAHVGCSCGWNADGNSYKKEGDWHDHMAAAPPVPASGGTLTVERAYEQWCSVDWKEGEEPRTYLEHLHSGFVGGWNAALAAAPAPASQPSQDANENLADYLLRTSPPSWDYKKVLDLAKAVATGASQPELLIGTDGDHHTQDWFDGYEEGRMHFEVTTPASQPDAWTAARHWLLTDDTPNDLALEEGSRRIASLAKLLASRASQPEQTAERLFDLVQETREKLVPFLRIETFTTGSQAKIYLAVDVILQAALEAALAALGSQPPSKLTDDPMHTCAPLMGLTPAVRALWNLCRESECNRTGHIPTQEFLNETVLWWLTHGTELRDYDKPSAALASPGSQPPNDSESAAGKTAEATTQGTVTPPDSPQPLEANLEYLRNLAATDISNEIPLTDAQFNWLQERLRKLVRAVVGTGESRK